MSGPTEPKNTDSIIFEEDYLICAFCPLCGGTRMLLREARIETPKQGGYTQHTFDAVLQCLSCLTIVQTLTTGMPAIAIKNYLKRKEQEALLSEPQDDEEY